MGSKIFGKFLRFEQPERERRWRDFNLQMLVGRLRSILQSSISSITRPERNSTDEGSTSMAVPLKRKCFMYLGSSGNLSREKHPCRLRNWREFSLQGPLGRCLRLLQKLRSKRISFSIDQIDEGISSMSVPCKYKNSIFLVMSGRCLSFEQPPRFREVSLSRHLKYGGIWTKLLQDSRSILSRFGLLDRSGISIRFLELRRFSLLKFSRFCDKLKRIRKLLVL